MYVLELGGQDDAFAAAEAASAADGVERLAPGLAAADAVTDRVRGLAFTRRASSLVGTCDPDVERATATLAAATADLDRSGSVAVRAVDVRGSTGVDTPRAERELGSVLVDRGLTVDLDDPDHELRALFADPAGDEERDAGDGAGADGGAVCALGWLVAESVRDYGDRRPTDRPFFQPGSMDPLEARAVANLAGARPGRRVVDPMCGTGGMLVEAALLGADVLGGDRQPRMVAGSRENLRAVLGADRDPRCPEPGGWGVYRGDATRLPVDDADAVVFDAPYGRQSRIEGEFDGLVAGALAAARAVAPRAVVVADRSLSAPAREAGWTVEARFERRVHRSLTRHVHVLR